LLGQRHRGIAIARDYNALREVDIVTDVMEPGTIFRD